MYDPPTGALGGLINEMTFFNGLPENKTETMARMEELGSETTYNHYPAGWAHAMNTPFQWVKQVASHYGGTRNPLIISWPEKITSQYHGQMRNQWHHVIDIAPTILEAVGIKPPSKINGVAQRAYEGTPLGYSFFDASVPGTRTRQYFEMLGNRAIYDNDWVAATTPVDLPWASTGTGVDAINGYAWELYNEKDDPTQSNNIASKYPEKLAQLQTVFYEEAVKYNVLPIDNDKVARLDVTRRPSLTRGRRQLTYYEGMIRTPEGASPDTKNKDFNVTAYVEVPSTNTTGVLATFGGRFAGWTFYLKEGHLTYYYNLAGG